MGITTENFFENLYSVIFSPKNFFEREDITISTRLALFTVLIITGITKITSGIFNGGIYEWFFILSLIGNLIGATLMWFLSALFFEYIAKIFDRGDKLKEILFFTAFAPLPFIFFAPLNLLKDFGTFGYILSTNLEFLLYLWIIVLYAFAIRAVYKLTYSRAFMLILLPFFSSFFALYWLGCFIHKIWYIFAL